MSPNVLTIKNDSMTRHQIQKYQKTKKVILKYQEFIKNNFDYVGENFTYEARSLHYKNDKSLKRIYGTATQEDLKELKEEGVEIEVIPWIKDNVN